MDAELSEVIKGVDSILPQPYLTPPLLDMKKEELKEILCRIEDKEFFVDLVKQSVKDAKNNHPHYQIKDHEAMSIVKRFTGNYYTYLTHDLSKEREEGMKG